MRNRVLHLCVPWQAIVLGDTSCAENRGNSSPMQMAVSAKQSAWGPAVTGNIVLIGASQGQTCPNSVVPRDTYHIPSRHRRGIPLQGGNSGDTHAQLRRSSRWACVENYHADLQSPSL